MYLKIINYLIKIFLIFFVKYNIYNFKVLSLILICSKQKYNIDFIKSCSNSFFNDIIEYNINDNIDTCTNLSMKSGIYK